MAIQVLKTHKNFEGITQFWEHQSEQTKTRMKFSTFTPAEKPKGCLIWLSGLTCTEETFMIKAGAQRFLAKHRLMAICPDTSPRGLHIPGDSEAWDFGVGAGFYVDATTPAYSANYRMYSYVAQEIYQIIQDEFSVAANRISIFGHSMGGHGALVIGLREPEKFRSISAFAPIANPVNCPWGEKAFTGYLGDNRETWKKYDATELVKSGKRHPQALLIDQGTKDEFLEKQLLPENFSLACSNADQALQLQYREGYDHGYYFISTFVDSHIEFHSSAL